MISNSINSSSLFHKNKNSIAWAIKNIKYSNNNLIPFRKSLKIKSIIYLKNNTERNEIKKMFLHSPVPRRIDEHARKNNLNLKKLFVYDKINIEEEKNFKKDNFCNGQFTNTYINSILNSRYTKESKKNKIIEINRFQFNNPSNSSFRNLSPKSIK